MNNLKRRLRRPSFSLTAVIGIGVLVTFALTPYFMQKSERTVWAESVKKTVNASF